MSPEMFDQAWPYVDSVYTTLRGETIQAYGKVRVKTYECRLRKSKKSNATREVSEGRGVKRRHSSVRNPGLCNVRMEVSRPVDGSPVTIERLDEHTHLHDIEENFRVKKPTILLDYITTEAVKNYSASQIFRA